jgi:hypothetical protein
MTSKPCNECSYAKTPVYEYPCTYCLSTGEKEGFHKSRGQSGFNEVRDGNLASTEQLLEIRVQELEFLFAQQQSLIDALIEELNHITMKEKEENE